MRYATASALSMTALTRGVAAPPLVGAGVAASGSSHLSATRLDAAWAAAVALPAVAPAADQEDQAASNAVPLPGAVVILSRNRGLQPRGAGRAALSRGDFDRIPASLLMGDRGARFVDYAPLGRFFHEAGVFYSTLARAATALARSAGRVSRRANSQNQIQGVLSTWVRTRSTTPRAGTRCSTAESLGLAAPIQAGGRRWVSGLVPSAVNPSATETSALRLGVQHPSVTRTSALLRIPVGVHSRVGNCWDNAVMESFFGTFKQEWANHQRWRALSDAKLSTLGFIEVFYNCERLHSSLGYMTPAEADAAAV